MNFSLAGSFTGGEDRLISINVKVLNKDNRFGGRIVDISFGSSSFKTPHRTATHKDYHAASSLPHNVTIGNPVSEYVSSFNNTSFDESMEAIKSDDLPAYFESREFTKGRVDSPPKKWNLF